MLKKVLIALCAVSLAACSVIGASAQENLISQYQQAYSTVEYENPSNFEVVIPETIDGNEGILTFTALHMNLHDNETVEVYSDGGNVIDLTSETTEDIAKYNITVDDSPVATFGNGELTSQYSIYPWVENAREIAAAHYSGTATFRIRLVEN